MQDEIEYEEEEEEYGDGPIRVFKKKDHAAEDCLSDCSSEFRLKVTNIGDYFEEQKKLHEELESIAQRSQ